MKASHPSDSWSSRPARLFFGRGWLASVLAGGLVAAASAGEPAPFPVPPLPEDVRTEPAAVPVLLDRDPAGPLPLGGSPTAGQPAAGRVAPAGEWTVLAAIATAFGLLAAFRFQQTRRRPRGLPPDVYELLGAASLGGQHGVRVVRFGPRTLLLSVSPSGCQTLASLDDPQATERIVAACLGPRPPEPAARPTPRRAASAPAQHAAAGEEAA